MKKVLSISLAIIMVFSLFSIIPIATDEEIFTAGVYQFYLKDYVIDGQTVQGAYIVNMTGVEEANTVSFPLGFRYDSDTNATVAGYDPTKDDTVFEDPFIYDYVSLRGFSDHCFDTLINNGETITKVEIPRYAVDFSPAAFYDLSDLTEISVNAKNTDFSSLGGSLYNKDQTAFLYHPQQSADNTIASTVTSIDAGAFMYSENITSIVIPSGVTAIPNNCFRFCYSLSEVDFSQCAVSSIGEFAFADNAIESLELPASIQTIGNFAFLGNQEMSSCVFAENVSGVSVGVGAFISCPIDVLTLSREIVSIGDKAFGYYYDASLNIQKYENMHIRSFKYHEDMAQTTAAYDYCTENDHIVFIPLDVFEVSFSYMQFEGFPTEMYMYRGKFLKYSTSSSTGVFNFEDIPQGKYNIYFKSKFGVLTVGGGLDIGDDDDIGLYRAVITRHCPVGNVNGDDMIDLRDISALLVNSVYGSSNNDYDINQDGSVGIDDLSIVLAKNNYGKKDTTIQTSFMTPITPIT